MSREDSIVMGGWRAHEARLEILLPVLSVVLLILLWKLASQVLPERFFPSPESTFVALLDLVRSGAAFSELRATMARVALGFVLAMLLGICVGTCMGLYRNAERFFELPVVVGLAIPSLCYIIVCFMWFGLNERAAPSPR